MRRRFGLGEFADEHRCLVEPACGASLSVTYRRYPVLAKARRIVIVVCGGIGVDLNLLQTWKRGLENGK